MGDQRSWAVLAYLVADDKAGCSPLDEAARAEIAAICQAADLTRMHVAVQVHFNDQPGIFRATFEPTKSKEFGRIEAFDFWAQIVSTARTSRLELFREPRDLDSASTDVLKEFLLWGRQQCPAERYLILFYGHAFGPQGL